MIGELVGNYEVLACIGEGGMGVVYMARHRMIGRRVAIKVLRPGTSHNQEMVQRFFNEARSTSALKHVGLVDVFDFGYHNGRAYIAMELLEGESLAARLVREGRASPELLASVGRQVASAVGAAHARGIVHRDLKPDNVFLVPDDEVAVGVRAKVLDFGIAKLSDEESGSFRTRTGSLMGTPAYMSPEQCRGAGEVDHRSDIYSLGCILFELATGRTPYVRDAIGPMMMAHMIEEPPRPRQLNPALPEKLEDVICRAMAKRPEDRFPSMEVMAVALGGKTTLGGAATSLAVDPRAPRAGRRRWVTALVSLVLAGGGIAAATIALAPGTPTSTQPVQQPAAAPPVDVQPVSPPPAPPPPAVAEPAPPLPPPPVVEEKERRSKRRHKKDAGATGAPPSPDGTIDPFAPPRKP